MSRLFALSLCLLSLAPSLAFAEEFTADSKITAVTVYSDRATITRQAVIQIPAGSHTVSFDKLPNRIIADSLRADGSAASAVKFGAVVRKQVANLEIVMPQAKELNDKIESLQDQRKIIDNEKQALAAKKAFLNNIGTQATLRTNEAIAEINLKPDQWANAAQAIYTGLSEILSADTQLDIKIREIDNQLMQLRSTLYNLNSGQSESFNVSVPLESSAATTLTLNLSYQVTNASWNPIYDARLNTQSGQLDLVQYGAVRQRTGEDWEGIKLTLSTAQPQRGASLPDLTPYWIDLLIASPVPVMQEAMEVYNDQRISEAVSVGQSRMPTPISPPKTFLPAPASNEAGSAGDPLQRWRQMQEEKLLIEREKNNVQFSVAKMDTGGFVSEYKITGPASVTADGTESKLMVGRFDTDSLLQVHIKPQISTDAFLVSKAKLKGDSPVLPGAVSLFRDGAYVGQTSIPLLRPDEEHVMFFGTDDQVSVKRKVLKDEKKDAGMILRENTQERRFITEIMNLHTKPVQIVVKETIPTGRNEKISSEILKDETLAGYEQDSANIKGLLRWQFELEPKAKKDVKLGWKVTWPKDTSLSGL